MRNRHKCEGRDEPELQLLEVTADNPLHRHSMRRQEQYKALIQYQVTEGESLHATGAKTLH